MSARSLLVMALSLGLSLAAALAETRERALGGEVPDELAYDIQPTADGGFILTGTYAEREDGTGQLRYDDILLMKTDALGNETWTRSFGVLGKDVGQSVRQTVDGGFIVAGYRYGGFTSGDDVYLIRTDADGNEIWSNLYGDRFTNRVGSVLETDDGGFVVAGATIVDSGGVRTSDAYLLKVDAGGNAVWLQTYGTTVDEEFGNSAEHTADGGFILAGDTRPFGGGDTDAFLLRVDADGNAIWSNRFGFEDVFDNGHSAQQTSDGGFIMAGSSGSFDESDIYVVRTDADGNELWSNTFNGLFWDEGKSVQQTADGGFIVGGDTWTAPIPFGHRDAHLIQIDALGNEVWSKTIGRDGWEVGNSVLQTADGGFLVAGATRSFGDSAGSDVYLAYYNPATPTPEIRANGSAGAINLRQGDALVVTVSLDAGERDDEDADWWIVADSSVGPLSYDYDLATWQPGVAPAYQGPLFGLPESPIFEGSLPPGSYTLYFVVDLPLNGTVDADRYSDALEVLIVP